MTALVSCWLPSAFHIWPDERIMAGMDASTMTSLGTCRLVVPRSESTMARPGRSASVAAMSASMASRCAAGSDSTAASTLAQPSLGSAPAAASASACRSNTGAKNARTAWPKTIGSATFIMVALRCSENSTPPERASAIWSSRNSRSAETDMNVESTMSPAPTGTLRIRRTFPSLSTCSMLNEPAPPAVTDCSFERKSPPDIVDTWLWLCGDQAPIEWGYWRAYSFTARGARRSELPSRSTGFTADPFTRSKRSRISRSEASEGSSG